MAGKSANITGHSCPNCEFERRRPGKSVAMGSGVMLCTVCDTRWRTFATANPKRRKPTQSRILKPVNTIDNRVFSSKGGGDNQSKPEKKLTKEPRPVATLDYRSSDEKSANPFTLISSRFYLIAALIPIVAMVISVAMTLSNNSRQQKITISDVSMRKMVGRQGLNATIGGKMSNSSGKSQPAPDLQLVLLTKDGQKLRQWRYNPPVSTIAHSSSLVFETTIGNVPKSAERIEINFPIR